jgi:tetratricopeptide (TPR) repeat protein
MIRFALALFTLLAWAAPVWAQSYPPNERPMYGGVKQDDQKFIDSVIASGYTRKSGAQEAVARGFQSFEKSDYGPAMRRFNQAWVLDPDYAETYRGFALVLIARDRKPDEAEAMFKKGTDLPGASAGLLADYGRFLVLTKRLKEAIPVLERGAVAEGEAADQIKAQRLLADAYYDEKQFDKACPLAKKIIDKVEETRARESMQFIVTSPRCEE